MGEVKSLVESKTFWGAVMALVGSGLSAGHYTLTPADAASAIDIVVSIVSGIGGLIAIVGRVLASRRIVSVTPKALVLLAALGAGAAALHGVPADAQEHHRPVFTGDPVRDFEAAQRRAQTKIAGDLTSVAKQIEALLDTGDAIKLATQIPGLQDTVGAACWQSFDGLSQVWKAHPLPVSLHVAADIEAARLTAMALNQICTNPNCGQMWTDAQNAAGALSIAPMPFALESLCAKVPAIGALNAAATTPVQPAATALGGTPPAPAPATPAAK